MSTAVIDFPQTAEIEEEAAKRKAEAQRHLDAIRKANTIGSTSSLRIGWHGFALKRDNLFGILGFSCERDVWEAAEVCDSTWYANLRIAEAFDGLDEASFCRLKQANAKELSKLPQSKRMSKEWIDKAEKEPIQSFKLQIEDELNGKATDENGKEATVSYNLKMPKSRRKIVQHRLLEYANKVGVAGDESRALELLVAEKADTPSLVGTIITAVQRLKKVKELCESGLSSDEILAQVIVLNEESILEFSNALQALESEVE